MTTSLRAVMVASLVLALGFALLGLSPVRVLFEGVAVTLAWLSGAALAAFGHPVLRAGTELRDPVAGWGMDVTHVCDGHGLVIGLAALLVALGAGWRRGALILALGTAAIQAFNLARILVLALVLDRRPAWFESIHLEIFPLLTAGLLLLALGAVRPDLRRSVGRALLALAALAAAWLAGADALAAAALVPAANLLGWLAGDAATGPIAPRPDGWVVETLLIAARDPLSLHRLPIHPADFAIAWPALAAAALVAGRRAWRSLALAAAISALALMVGTRTELWLMADAAGATEQAVPVAEGRFRVAVFAPPPDGVQAAVRLLQNVLVHLNLLVLPGLILAGRRIVPVGGRA